jgi:RimJ/RimL family protein N-acetyltransferase
MTPDEQRAHVARLLAANNSSFGRGPKWCFAVDCSDASYVAYVDFDLANEHVPVGEANISYSSHPAHRGRGYVARAVQLVARFIAENTDARRAHLIVDSENTASLRVARAVGAVETGRWVNERGRSLIRHEIEIRHELRL